MSQSFFFVEKEAPYFRDLSLDSFCRHKRKGSTATNPSSEARERDRPARRVKRKRRDGKRRWRKLWPNDYRGLFSLSSSLDREKDAFRPYLSIRRHDLAAKVPKKDFRVLRRLSTLCFFFFFLCRSCFFPGLDCRQTSIFPKLLYFTSYGFLRFLAALQ